MDEEIVWIVEIDGSCPCPGYWGGAWSRMVSAERDPNDPLWDHLRRLLVPGWTRVEGRRNAERLLAWLMGVEGWAEGSRRLDHPHPVTVRMEGAQERRYLAALGGLFSSEG